MSNRIKAIFFDWLGTVAHPEPDRHESVYLVAKEMGYELPPANELVKSVYKAENQETQGAPGLWSEGKDETPFVRWWDVLLADVGVDVPRQAKLEMTRRLSQKVRSVRWVLYDDVVPSLKELKQRGFLLGLISNLYVGRAGLEPFLDIVITPKEVGVSKPDALIFLTALQRAEVEAKASIYVGDQYESDVVGAKRVGIQPILIDRYDVVTNVVDCPLIHSFYEVMNFV